MRINTRSVTIPFIVLFIAIVILSGGTAILIWNYFGPKEKTYVPQTLLPQPVSTVPHRGCIDRGAGQTIQAPSFDDMDGKPAYFIPRSCQGVYELRDKETGKITATVEFENGAVFVMTGNMTIGIR